MLTTDTPQKKKKKKELKKQKYFALSYRYLNFGLMLRKPVLKMLMTKIFATIVIVTSLLLAAEFSLASPPSSRIVNGILVEPGEFPYVVSLQLNDKHICGGLIYNDLFVLTAASCVQKYIIKVY